MPVTTLPNGLGKESMSLKMEEDLIFWKREGRISIPIVGAGRF